MILLLPIATTFMGTQNESDNSTTQFSTEKSSSKITKLNEDNVILNHDIESEYSNNAMDLELTARDMDNERPITMGTRATRVDHIEDQDDKPGYGTQFSQNESLLVGSAPGNDIDWFYTTSFNAPADSGKVYNITFRPNSFYNFGSNEDWIHVRLYSFWDFNGDDKLDDKELILLHQESWNPWNSYTVGWGIAGDLGRYCICVEGQPKSPSTNLNYEIYVVWYMERPLGNETNYQIENALEITSYTPIKNKMIDMDSQPFDWYSIAAPKSSLMMGINVSVRVKFEASSLRSPYSDGTAMFVLELRAVIIHERSDGKRIFGGIGNSSQHLNQIDYPPLKKQVRYHDIQFFSPTGSGRIVKSYIGIFIQTYGIDIDDRWIRYYDGTTLTREEDAALNSWVEYSFVEINSIPVIQPVLDRVGVFSTKTLSMYGRTPDLFVFIVSYVSKANYAPIKMKVHILRGANEDPIVGTLLPLGDYTNFMTPTEWVFTMWGSQLGEGDYNFQIECFDKHTYAKGSKVDKIIYPGPFIKNNIPPQIRETAVTYIEMKEDDKPIYLKLKDIFADADDDPLSYFIVNKDGNNTFFWQTPSLRLRIIDNSKLRIEPIPNMFGKSTISIMATDKISPYINATHKIIVTVVPVNDAPEIKIPFDRLFFFGEIRFDEDTSYRQLNLTDVFWDPVENEPLTFSVSGNENLKVNILPNGSVIITPKENWYGVEELRFTATDPPGDSVYDDLKVRVVPVNDRPILNDTPPIIAYEDSWTNITFKAYDPADEDPLEFSTDVVLVIKLNEDEYIFNQYTGKLRLYPSNRVATGETYVVTVTVRDMPSAEAGKSLSMTKTVNITIRNTWDKPVCHILEPRNGDNFLHFEPITFRGKVDDPDLLVPQLGEKITFEWVSDIDGKLGDKEQIRNVPLSAGSSGQEHKITLRVSDGKFVSSKSIKVWVLREDQRKDTDGDGMPDYWEDRNYLDKYFSQDADYDGDNDNFTNYEEFYYGFDGDANTNDPTNPWDRKDHPQTDVFEEQAKKEEEADYFWPVVILILIIIVMIACIFGIYMSVSKQIEEAREYSERKHSLEEQLKKLKDEQEKELKYGVYSPKKADVLCHNCGHRNSVTTSNRPLAVTCEQCEHRGVIY
jgi:hypothetical protein